MQAARTSLTTGPQLSVSERIGRIRSDRLQDKSLYAAGLHSASQARHQASASGTLKPNAQAPINSSPDLPAGRPCGKLPRRSRAAHNSAPQRLACPLAARRARSRRVRSRSDGDRIRGAEEQALNRPARGRYGSRVAGVNHLRGHSCFSRRRTPWESTHTAWAITNSTTAGNAFSTSSGCQTHQSLPPT